MTGIDVYRSHSLHNIFHLFFAAAKACLLPFITLYFRQLGLTATHTGIIIGIQLWLRIWVSPLWMRCAVKFNKNHFMLLLSLFVMMASTLLLTLIPPVDPRAAIKYCNHSNRSSPHDISSNISSVFKLKNDTNVNTTYTAYLMGANITASTQKQTSVSTATTTVATTTTTTTMTATTSFVPIARQPSYYSHPRNGPPNSGYPSSVSKPRHRTSGKGIHQTAYGRLTHYELALLNKYNVPLSAAQNLTPKQLNRLLKRLEKSERQREHKTWESRRTRRNVMDTVHTKLSQLQRHITELGINSPFCIVLTLIIIGELFSVHVERFTDKLWFDFLDGIDDLERYGQYGLWSLASFMVFPLIATTLVDYTPCMLPHGIDHFMIHFYMFAIFLGIAFICSYWYPVRIVNSLKSIFRKNRFMKGCKVLVGDIHCFSFAFSVFLSGLLFAGVDNFLFWHVQDIGGSEVIMGAAVSFAAMAEFIMYLSMDWFLKRLGHVAAMSLALLMLAVRLVLYSLVWMPWMVIPLALLQAFTHALMWGAVCSYPDFKLNPSIMDRSAHWVLVSCHHGVGVAVGSIVAGLLYEHFGIALVFQGAAVAAFLWLLVFMAVNRFVRKVEEVKYERLLQADDNKNDESLTWEDDDWLESAMKDEP